MKCKSLLPIICIVIFINCNNSSSNLFDSTIQLILKNNDLIKEVNGKVNDTIKDNVFDLIYNKPDIKFEKKIELLHTLIYYQSSSSKVYRAKISSLFKNNDSSIIQNPVFLIPFSTCYYCDYYFIDNIDFNLALQIINSKPFKYKQFYLEEINELIAIRNSSNKKKHPKDLSKRLSRKIINSIGEGGNVGNGGQH